MDRVNVARDWCSCFVAVSCFFDLVAVIRVVVVALLVALLDLADGRVRPI